MCSVILLTEEMERFVTAILFCNNFEALLSTITFYEYLLNLTWNEIIGPLKALFKVKKRNTSGFLWSVVCYLVLRHDFGLTKEIFVY